MRERERETWKLRGSEKETRKRGMEKKRMRRKERGREKEEVEPEKSGVEGRLSKVRIRVFSKVYLG